MRPTAVVALFSFYGSSYIAGSLAASPISSQESSSNQKYVELSYVRADTFGASLRAERSHKYPLAHRQEPQDTTECATLTVSDCITSQLCTVTVTSTAQCASTVKCTNTRIACSAAKTSTSAPAPVASPATTDSVPTTSAILQYTCTAVTGDALRTATLCPNTAPFCDCGGAPAIPFGNMPIPIPGIPAVPICVFPTRPMIGVCPTQAAATTSTDAPAPTTDAPPPPPATTNTPSQPTDAPAPPPSPAYQTGTCHLQIMEQTQDTLASSNVHGSVEVFDNGGKSLGNTKYNFRWGQTATVSAQDSKLPYDVAVEFTSSLKKRSFIPRLFGRAAGPPGLLLYPRFKVHVSAGDTKWTFDDTNKKKMPYCTGTNWVVGEWKGINILDPYRNVTCYWSC